MKLSERKKQMGITLHSVLIEDMAGMGRNCLGQMWRAGDCDKVEGIMIHAQQIYDDSIFLQRKLGGWCNYGR